MGCIYVSGGNTLYGETRIQGSKNAVLPLMAAAVLHRGITVIHNCPEILDVDCMRNILEELGCKTKLEHHTLQIDATVLKKNELPLDLTVKMRGSVLLMGSLLGRCGEVSLPFPGGCVIGSRPVNYHIDIMRSLGAEVICEENRMLFRAGRLKGTDITLPFPSVGATENAVLAAALAEGQTILKGCAREPEIRELCDFLREKGVKITWLEDVILVEGCGQMHDSEYTIMPDRIVAGTYLLAACATKGKITLQEVPAEDLQALTDIIKNMNGHLKMYQYKEKNITTVKADCRFLRSVQIHVKTAPYPGFPTDLQSQLMAVEASRDGDVCVVKENLFESRFLIVEELRKMRADIVLCGHEAKVTGRADLHASDMKVKDLRGGAALVLAALAAKGTSRIAPDDYIKRGYENISKDLEELGADIRTLNG